MPPHSSENNAVHTTSLSDAFSELQTQEARTSMAPVDTYDDTPEVCVVCMEDDARPTHAFVPCGHQCVCKACSELITGHSGNGRCPYCRASCFMAMAIFKSSA
eukprot:3200250-Prymnesium_polylepis.1